jgi:hypothetical protein
VPLYILAQPAFITAWYSIGALAAWIVYDLARVNTAVPPALKLAWPIVAVFFSVVGLLLYLTTSRPSDMGRLAPEQRRERFSAYSRSTVRKVAASVNHCVGGDGLGMVTAMVLARAWRFSFLAGILVRVRRRLRRRLSTMLTMAARALERGGIAAARVPRQDVLVGEARDIGETLAIAIRRMPPAGM